jgi:uncharacterized membrane protein HdeD (DUF308 family)
MDTTLLKSIGRSWWLVLLRGIASIVFGVLAYIWPGLTLVVLVAFWGAYALVDGVFALVAGIRMRDSGGGKPMWAMILVGILGIAAGIVTFLWPGVIALALLTFIAAWAIVMGVFQVIAAIRLRKEIENEWWLGLSGVLAVVFGVLLLANPGAGALALIWVIAAFELVFGILLVMLAFRLKRHADAAPNAPAAA